VSHQVSGTVLDSLSFRAYQQYKLPNLGGGGFVKYFPSINMKIDTLEVSRGATVATLKVFAGVWWGSLYVDSMVLPIYSTPFFNQNPTLYDFGGDFFTWDTTIVNHFNKNCDFLTFRIESADTCDLWFDYLKAYDVAGKELIEDTIYNARILSYVSTSNLWVDSSVIGWYLNDEPEYTNFAPIGYISAMIRSRMPLMIVKQVFPTE